MNNIKEIINPEISNNELKVLSSLFGSKKIRKVCLFSHLIQTQKHLIMQQ